MKYFKIIVIIYLICEMASASALNSKMEKKSKESRHVGIVEDFLGLNEESEFGLQTGLPVNHNIVPPPNKEKTLKATKSKTHILAHKQPAGEKKAVGVKHKAVKPAAVKKPATKKTAKPKKANDKLAKHDKPDKPEKPDKRHPQKKVTAVPKGKAVTKKAAALKKKADPKAATQKSKAVPKKAAAPKPKAVPNKAAAAPTKKPDPKKAAAPKSKAVPKKVVALKTKATETAAKPVVLKSNTKTISKAEVTLAVKV